MQLSGNVAFPAEGKANVKSLKCELVCIVCDQEAVRTSVACSDWLRRDVLEIERDPWVCSIFFFSDIHTLLYLCGHTGSSLLHMGFL